MTGKTECPCCNTKLNLCPFCGGPAKIYGQNMVGCIDNANCGGTMDFGHWSGHDDDGIPAEHYVVEQWNKRIQPPKGDKDDLEA